MRQEEHDIKRHLFSPWLCEFWEDNFSGKQVTVRPGPFVSDYEVFFLPHSSSYMVNYESYGASTNSAKMKEGVE